jgi:prepilin-type N-terminal cleavage/methylation domain-containing protein
MLEKRNIVRKGVTLIELSIVLVIAGIIIVGVFAVAPKIMTGSKADVVVSAFSGLDNALESAKANNSGAYKAVGAATAITTAALPAIASELGGDTATKDLTGWTYRCPAGSGQTMTIVTSSLESPAVQAAALSKINGRYAPWSAVASGTNALTITKSNVTCQ